MELYGALGQVELLDSFECGMVEDHRVVGVEQDFAVGPGITGDDHGFGEIQRDLVDVGDRAAVSEGGPCQALRSPKSTSAWSIVAMVMTRVSFRVDGGP